MKKMVDNSELYVWVRRLNKIMNIVFYVNVAITILLIYFQNDFVILSIIMCKHSSRVEEC